MRSSRTSWALLLCLLCASNPGSPAERIEAGMQVSGTITIETDGAVLTHAIDPKYSLTSEITGLIGREVALWRFEPVLVDGKPIRARVPMYLRLLAQQDDKGGLVVRVASTSFGGNGGTNALRPKDTLTPPVFPGEALGRGNSGTVYLVVRIDRKGIVTDAAAERVDLDEMRSTAEMKDMRRVLAKAAIRATKRWRFIPPSTGGMADKSHWLARIPVSFKFIGDPEDFPGAWDTYVPGPRNMDIPWAREELRTAGSPDALPADGGSYMLDGAPKLLAPPAS